MIDQDFTEKYLSLLVEFSTFLMRRQNALPDSEKNQLSSFIFGLKDKCQFATKQIKAGKKINTEISIEPNIIFSYKNPVAKAKKFYISLGGNLKISSNTIVEQSLCLNLLLEHTEHCEALPAEWMFYDVEEGFHVLRRFHFDYDAKNDDFLKPKFHLQYGGRLQENYLDVDKVHYKLFKPIDYPRLPQQPHDFVMLLDFILREFNIDGVNITDESKWNSCVIKSEKLWLKPYYLELLSRLDSGSRKSPIHRAV